MCHPAPKFDLDCIFSPGTLQNKMLKNMKGKGCSVFKLHYAEACIKYGLLKKADKQNEVK